MEVRNEGYLIFSHDCTWHMLKECAAFAQVALVCSGYIYFLSNLPFPQDAYKVGVGSGSTVVYAVERLGKFCCHVKF